MSMRICGFEFRVGGRWVRLQGFGGQLGDGALAAVNEMTAEYREKFLDRLLPNLLKEAKRLDEQGYLREHCDVDDYRKRIVRISGPVEDIRVRWSKK